MSGLLATYEWGQLPWRKLEVAVFKLQKRIYKASQAGDVRRVGVDSSSRQMPLWRSIISMVTTTTTGTSILRRFTVTVTTRYTVGKINSLKG